MPTPVSLVTHYATISTNKGSFVVELLDDIADVYVSNFLKLQTSAPTFTTALNGTES